MRFWIPMVLLTSWACDDAPRERDGEEPDAAVADDDARVAGDAGVVDDAGEIDPDGAPDAGADAVAPDGPPPPPEVCNGEDEDGDGEIDEGVSNLCGGCGGIPPDGCQAWIVTAIQNDEDRLNPDQVVGFAGGALGFSERDIEGATCTFFRSPAQHPDAHLGLVNVESPRAELNLTPVFRADRGTHGYQNSPELGLLQLHGEGDVVEVRAGGGLAVGPFQMEATAPAPLSADWTEDQLETVLDLARGDRAEGIRLEWTPNDSTDDQLRFFVGGSIPVFNLARRRYEVREHYELTALLNDDGDFELPPDLVGGGVPDSSIRAFVERRVVKRLPQGPHAIEMRLGQRLTVTRNGLLENDVPPEFRIVEPSAAERTIVAGEPMPVAWEWPGHETPPGPGPLRINLLLRDTETLQTTQVECVVEDPTSGRIVLPADFTEDWPDLEADTRLLSLSWGLHRLELPPPDRGVLTRSVSAQMWLLP